MRLGESRRIICSYQNYLMVQSRAKETIVTLVASRNAPLDVLTQYSELVESLASKLQEQMQ